MSAIVGIIGVGGEGGTFLDWSLHFLVGDKHMSYTIVDRVNDTILHENVVFPILSNPLVENGTAHYHRKTHPTDKTLPGCIEIAKNCADDSIKIHTMYIVGNLKSYENKGYQILSEEIIAENPSINYIQYCFTPDIANELSYRIINKIPNIDTTIDKTNNMMNNLCMMQPVANSKVYMLLAKDMFYNLDTEIHKIFDWLKLEIDAKVYDHWLSIYRLWQVKNNFTKKIAHDDK